MPVIERDVVLTGRDGQGRTTMDFPVTRLGLIEDGAQVREAPEAGDYLPVLSGGQMQKVSLQRLRDAINSAQGEASGSQPGLLSAQDKRKLDGIAAGATKNEPSAAAPEPLGTASAGSQAGYARGDHVHPRPTPAQLGAAAAGHSHSMADLSGAVFHAGAAAPANKGLLWIDTTATTGGLKYYNGSAWVHVPVSTT